jgi:FkbM family methyltransferase
MTALRQIAGRSRTIIDIGANVGRYSWYFARHARDESRLIALEPHPGCARLLRQSLGSRKGSVVLEVAAGATDGTATLNVPTGAFGSSVAGLAWVEEEAHSAHEGAIRIAIRRLDGLIEDGMVGAIGPVFMKIDVEGGEAGVLRGATSLLNRHRPVIYMECQAAMLARHGETPKSIWQLLTQAGYTMFAMRAGALVRMSAVDPEVVNYLCMPDAGTNDAMSVLDLATLRRMLDAWASQTGHS